MKILLSYKVSKKIENFSPVNVSSDVQGIYFQMCNGYNYLIKINKPKKPHIFFFFCETLLYILYEVLREGLQSDILPISAITLIY